MKLPAPSKFNNRRASVCGALCVIFVMCAALSVCAQTSVVSDAVRVIPPPKLLKATGERFPLDANVRVALADSRSDDDRFAAQDFIDDVRETSHVSLSVGRKFGRRAILIGAVDNASIRAALEKNNFAVPSNLNEEGYLLNITPREIIVAGRSSAGIFYGLQTLKQLVRGERDGAYVQGAQIVDYPTMRWRAVSDDISRGSVPTVAYIKRQIRAFAAYKLNMHSFYMEHTFKSRAHPLINAENGLTPEDIRELVAYAKRYHVEIVPEQQTFGHLHKALKLEKYNELAETPYGDVLSPQQEGSYKLVADWYKGLNELFPGQFFHIGADETFELGEGQSREAVKREGVGAVYFAHLRRVAQLLKPYNRRLMFWGDIALSHPDLIGSVPKDLIVMNWAYSPRDSYAARIEPFKKAGLEQFVCPGTQSWNQIFPNEDFAAVNIPNFVRDGQKAGAIGMMNTTWDDDGESLFEMTWYGIVMGAAASWSDAPLDVKKFDDDFDWAFFRHDGHELTKAIRALGGVNLTLGILSSDVEFWRNPFTADFQMNRARALNERTKRMRLLVEDAEESLLREKDNAHRNQKMIGAMSFAARRFDHLGRRMEVVEQFSNDYWNAYLNLGDKRKVQRLRRYTGAVSNNLREMAEELTGLRNDYRALWLEENRPYWLDTITARYDYAISRWLAESKAIEDALRAYEQTSTLPNPETFGLGARPAEASGNSSD